MGCRLHLRAETLSHAAVMYGKSGFLGLKEADHGRSTVELIRARGSTLLMEPPNSYGLSGLVQTVLAYCVVYSAEVPLVLLMTHSMPTMLLRVVTLRASLKLLTIDIFTCNLSNVMRSQYGSQVRSIHTLGSIRLMEVRITGFTF